VLLEFCVDNKARKHFLVVGHFLDLEVDVAL